MPRRYEWAHWAEDKLLKLRLKDLHLSVDGTWLEGCLHDLYDELEQRSLRIRPHVWLSDEWFSPDTTPGIAIPFYLAHPRLMRLERKMIIDVEGGTRRDCMRILRHETGHVIQNSFRLQRRRRWQELFGNSSTRYPSFYRPNPASKNYVQHLRLWYGQSHPDEDFAETFAVWLKPEYVDEVMAELAGQRSPAVRGAPVHPLSQIKTTLAHHYENKQALYAVETPRTYDRELHRIFSNDPKHRHSPTAASFIRKHRSHFRQTVARWTGEYQLTLDSLLDDMIDRCQELKLRAVGPERQLRTDFTVLLTAKTVHSLYSPSRRQWYAL
jgi:hypothetical protein